ncbi:MAG: T9SS type A sorting domain-containing protein, partial [Flavobacteriales bacterium]|nr:T9SS type A sorting domain-containing protein [Flavobacteriales bacterium]
ASVARPSVSATPPPSVCSSPTVGIKEKDPIAAVIGTYPNPFWENFVIKTYLFDSEDVSVQLFDVKGTLVQEVSQKKLTRGLHYIQVNGSGISEGTYLVKMTIGSKVFTRTVVRI